MALVTNESKHVTLYKHHESDLLSANSNYILPHSFADELKATMKKISDVCARFQNRTVPVQEMGLIAKVGSISFTHLL